MIEFEYVRYKNFLSTGDVYTDVSLNDGCSILIKGDNGSGKSTIVDALCFGLYGKPYRRINKAQIVNSINEKDCVVEISFDTKGCNYMIRRGIKPTFLEIKKDGVLVDHPARVADYQRILDGIIGFNYRSFCQVIVVGAKYFIPFMRLNAAERRSFVEDILGVNVFTEMRKMNIENIKENKQNIVEAEGNLKTILVQKKLNNELLNEVINRKEEDSERANKEIAALQEEVNVIEDKLTNFDKEVEQLGDCSEERSEELRNIYNKAYDKYRDSKHQLWEFEKGIKDFVDELDFYECNETCEVCGQDISEEFREEKKLELSDKIDELRVKFDKQKIHVEEIDLLCKNLEEKRGIFRTKQKMFLNKKAEMANLTDNLNAIKEKMNSSERENEDSLNRRIEEITNRLSRFQELENTHQSNFVKEIRKNAILSDVSNVLADDAAKAAIVKQYVPVINEKVNRYLAELDFFADFSIDETFEEVIRSRHRDEFSYDSFSEGERSRIDLAMLFAWRDIGAMLSSVSSNLLILDEVFDGSLDVVGVNELSRLLRISGHTVMVISHSGRMEDSFEKVITFEKRDMFSRIVEE